MGFLHGFLGSVIVGLVIIAAGAWAIHDGVAAEDRHDVARVVAEDSRVPSVMESRAARPLVTDFVPKNIVALCDYPRLRGRYDHPWNVILDRERDQLIAYRSYCVMAFDLDGTLRWRIEDFRLPTVYGVDTVHMTFEEGDGQDVAVRETEIKEMHSTKEGLVVVTLAGGRAYLLDANTGGIRWVMATWINEVHHFDGQGQRTHYASLLGGRRQEKLLQYFAASGVPMAFVDNGAMWLPGWTGHGEDWSVGMLRVDLATGQADLTSIGSDGFSQPARWRDRIVVARGNEIVEFTEATGELVSRFTFKKGPNLEASVLRRIAIEGDLLVLVGEGEIYVVDLAKGRTIRRFDAPVSGTLGDPILRRGVLVVGSEDTDEYEIGHLLGYDIHSGKLLWSVRRNITWARSNVACRGDVVVTVEMPAKITGRASLQFRSLRTGDLQHNVQLPTEYRPTGGQVPVIRGNDIFMCGEYGPIFKVAGTWR